MRRRPSRRSHRRFHPLLAVAALAAAPGCAELTAIGHVSDRETSSTISNVDIQASKDGKTWKSLGKTDGSGAYWILKAWIPEAARIKLARRGYYALEMSESDFTGSRSHLLTPTGQVSDPFDPAYEQSRRGDAWTDDSGEPVDSGRGSTANEGGAERPPPGWER